MGPLQIPDGTNRQIGHGSGRSSYPWNVESIPSCLPLDLPSLVVIMRMVMIPVLFSDLINYVKNIMLCQHWLNLRWPVCCLFQQDVRQGSSSGWVVLWVVLWIVLQPELSSGGHCGQFDAFMSRQSWPDSGKKLSCAKG